MSFVTCFFWRRHASSAAGVGTPRPKPNRSRQKRSAQEQTGGAAGAWKMKRKRKRGWEVACVSRQHCACGDTRCVFRPWCIQGPPVGRAGAAKQRDKSALATVFHARNSWTFVPANVRTRGVNNLSQRRYRPMHRDPPASQDHMLPETFRGRRHDAHAFHQELVQHVGVHHLRQGI